MLSVYSADLGLQYALTLTPSKIEAIDVGRRSLHNEGAEFLQNRLVDKVEMDTGTARRLFTLICVLHIRV